MSRNRQRHAVLAGHTGDEETSRALLYDADPMVRAAALGALGRMTKLARDDLVAALADGDAVVRRRACEEAARADVDLDLGAALADEEPLVVEAAAWAIGERGKPAAGEVERLIRVATGHDDPLCREAAVAALGALGDPAGLPAVLQATGDIAAIRRRAVLALAPFEGPEVEQAIQAALEDRDWQVRQAAEDLLRD